MIAKDNDPDNDLDSFDESNEEFDNDLDTGSSSSNKTGVKKVKEDKKQELAKRETVIVFRLRLLVFLVLLLAAVAVSITVYYITAGSENREAQTQYEGASEKVLETFINIVKLKMAAVTSLGVAAIAHGVDHKRTWPFVTLSSFQQRSATARAQSGALLVQTNPIVPDNQRQEWNTFIAGNDSSWIADALTYQESIGLFDFIANSEKRNLQQEQEREEVGTNSNVQSDNETSDIWYFDDSGMKVIDPGPGPYFPTWQQSPLFYNGSTLNQNLLRSRVASGAQKSFDTGSVVIGEFVAAPPGEMNAENADTRLFALLLSTTEEQQTTYRGDPMSLVFFPVFNTFADNRVSVALLVAWINWANYFRSILPANLLGIVFVLQDSCGGEFTYQIDGTDVKCLGDGDLHDTKYNDKRKSASFAHIQNIADGTKQGLPLNQQHCQVTIDVYPTAIFYDVFQTNTPVIITVAVAFVFVFTACMFLVYDRLVERRQVIVMRQAEQTTAIVTSLFPENVAHRLIQANAMNADDAGFVAPNRRLKSFLTNGADDQGELGLQPIADLFPNCTVLFADIVGFTAWSSTRDPAQVFILLQTLYQAFDAIAKQRGVFKVETIGDSYVAVTGLPEPQANHAVAMARFASDCKEKMHQLTFELEKKLGPDTADLSMRLGMHSGPVTAGVLRGERARFQLFGDTVNTASRMESTGMRDKIQVSQSTRDLLVKAGKEHWLCSRSDSVQAKGKGSMKTFWLNPTAKKLSAGSSSSGLDGKSEPSELGNPHETIPISQEPELLMKNDRLVDWMVEMLQEHMKKIIARKQGTERKFTATRTTQPGSTPLDEVVEKILLPKYDAKAFELTQNHGNAEVSPEIVEQLREYVSIIASAYRDNHFHNFGHACHVAMATNKFINRIVSPDLAMKGANKLDLACTLHEYTHGINSDPLTVFAIIFSALIHDVDHRGVPNFQLLKEQQELASTYHNKSVAEQNSLDIAWNLLMSEQFTGLRGCLFSNEAELVRFRQVLVNVVLATDIFDAELNNLRKNRWNKAFSELETSDEDKNDLRATIVIEHIIQASDVAHTMQHWHVYRKWNKRLFLEMSAAYAAGRMAKDPSTFWYTGELSFFDNYLIPLAKKLKDCNVFGVSSDECLNYVLANRAEWEDRGQEVVAEMVMEIASASRERPTGVDLHSSD